MFTSPFAKKKNIAITTLFFFGGIDLIVKFLLFKTWRGQMIEGKVSTACVNSSEKIHKYFLCISGSEWIFKNYGIKSKYLNF